MPSEPNVRVLLSGPLFTSADIEKIAGSATYDGVSLPYEPRKEFPPELIANELQEAFRRAIVRHLWEIKKNSVEPASRREWFKGIERAAEQLIGALRTDAASRPEDAPTIEKAALLYLQRAADTIANPSPRGAGIQAIFEHLPVLSSHLGIADQHIANGAPGECDAIARDHLHAGALLTLLPATLEMIRRIARPGASMMPQGKAGDHSDAFRSALFPSLFQIHRMVFGCEPKVHTDGDRDGPSVSWVQAVAEVAASRLPKVYSDDAGNALRCLRDLASPASRGGISRAMSATART